ncbi:MAG TPA: hypothetical protein VGC57_03455 [Cellulomonas sp.]
MTRALHVAPMSRARTGSLPGVLRDVRWSSLAVVLGAGALTLVCLVAVLRGRVWAVVPGLVCAGVALREVRALRRLDARTGTGRTGHGPGRRPGRGAGRGVRPGARVPGGPWT